MHHDLLAGIALVTVLGIGAQWLAWRTKIPSILLLLLVGLAVGPITGLLDVDALLGDLLFPVVSLSVAVILFEGGLSLRLRDIEGNRWVVRNLISVGVVMTWLLTAGAALVLLGLSLELSLILGATLVVTGPTVIIPLLKQIRPTHRVSSILRWEGIIIDPVGAILALLVFEEVLLAGADPGQGVVLAVVILVQTLFIGGIIGGFSARLMIYLYSRYLVPDSLRNPFTLMIVIGAFTVSNLIQTDAGLLTVTVMGIIMANQNRVDVQDIVEFKEILQVLLLSAVFVLLAARITPADLAYIGPSTIAFVAFMVLVERPAAVFISTWGSELNWRERLFIAWMAPRGIVAALVASIFALELAEYDFPGAELLVPITFSVIIGTVLIYSLTSGWLARRLGIVQQNPQGLLIVGAHAWGRDLAQAVQQTGFRVLLTDTNPYNVCMALSMGLEAHHCNILSDTAEEMLDLSGVGRLMALTPNDEVNTLASVSYRDTFGRLGVYQLTPHTDTEVVPDQVVKTQPTPELGTFSAQRPRPRASGRYVFRPGLTYRKIAEAYVSGSHFKVLPLHDSAEMDQLSALDVVPLFLATADGYLHIWSDDESPRPRAGQKVIVMSGMDVINSDI